MILTSLSAAAKSGVVSKVATPLPLRSDIPCAEITSVAPTVTLIVAAPAEAKADAKAEKEKK